MKKIVRFLLNHSGPGIPSFLVYSLFQFITETLNPLVEVFVLPTLLSYFIVFIRSNDDSSLVMMILLSSVIVISHFIFSFITRFSNFQRAKKNDSFQRHYMDSVLKYSMELKYSDTENADVLDKINIAKEGISPNYSNGIFGITDNVKDITNNVVIFFFSLVIVLLRNMILIAPLLLISGLFIVLIQKKMEKIEYDFYSKLAEVNRRFSYFTNNVAERKYSKDIRLYKAQDLILCKEKEYLNIQSKNLKVLERSILPYRILLTIISSLQYVSIILYGLLCLRNGSLTIPYFIQVINVSLLSSNSVSSLLKNITDLKLNCDYASDYVQLISEAEDFKNEDKNHVKKEENIVLKDNQNIYFKNISFSYPGSSELVLDDLNLTVEACKSLSIVGLSGEGKSTLIKLLCRLYDTYEGCILYGDTNILDIPISSWYNVITTVFQDFKLFPFSILDNITSGSGTLKEEEKVKELLPLNANLDSVYSKDLDLNGVQLSGGEEQKVALARAVNRSSSILVLDEPTSSLDAKAESDMYSAFNEITKNKTTLFISHRLASCKFTDKIAVLSKGKIIELGTHEELIKLSGTYAKMWAEQASMYYDENES